jgi:hypothetical protein
MTKHLMRSPSESLKMGVHIREQKREIATLMIVRDHPSRDPPEPLDAVGIGIIGRPIDQVEVLLQSGQHTTHEQGTCRGVRLEIVRKHDGDTPATLGTSNSSTHLLTKHISGASRCNPAIEPAIAPVYQTKAVDLAVISRCLDQTLPAPSFPRPDTGEAG